MVKNVFRNSIGNTYRSLEIELVLERRSQRPIMEDLETQKCEERNNTKLFTNAESNSPQILSRSPRDLNAYVEQLRLVNTVV